MISWCEQNEWVHTLDCLAAFRETVERLHEIGEHTTANETARVVRKMHHSQKDTAHRFNIWVTRNKQAIPISRLSKPVFGTFFECSTSWVSYRSIIVVTACS
jgi:hypothetical protein